MSVWSLEHLELQRAKSLFSFTSSDEVAEQWACTTDKTIGGAYDAFSSVPQLLRQTFACRRACLCLSFCVS